MLRSMETDEVVVISYNPGRTEICVFSDNPYVATKYHFDGPATLEITPALP